MNYYIIANISVSDKIQLASITVSSLISIIAIIISIASLMQNSKMIEESTRPNLQIYSVYLNSMAYIIIKNFGQSSCTIDSLTCDHKFSRDETFDELGENIFSNLSGAIMTPGFAIRCPLISYKVTKKMLHFEIKYHSTTKRYQDHFDFSIFSNSPYSDTHPSGNNDTTYLKNISRDLHDLIKLKL